MVITETGQRHKFIVQEGFILSATSLGLMTGWEINTPHQSTPDTFNNQGEVLDSYSGSISAETGANSYGGTIYSSHGPTSHTTHGNRFCNE